MVRWSSAKYIARVCERLPVEQVEQVIQAVLENFDGLLQDNDATIEHSLHGACLSVAELSRRGCLSAELAGQAVDSVLLVRLDGPMLSYFAHDAQ